jgi:hypothetical protein
MTTHKRGYVRSPSVGVRAGNAGAVAQCLPDSQDMSVPPVRVGGGLMAGHGNHCYQDGVLVCGWPDYHPLVVRIIVHAATP